MCRLAEPKLAPAAEDCLWVRFSRHYNSPSQAKAQRNGSLEYANKRNGSCESRKIPKAETWSVKTGPSRCKCHLETLLEMGVQVRIFSVLPLIRPRTHNRQRRSSQCEYNDHHSSIGGRQGEVMGGTRCDRDGDLRLERNGAGSCLPHARLGRSGEHRGTAVLDRRAAAGASRWSEALLRQLTLTLDGGTCVPGSRPAS